jgi:hypothetical protein
VDCCCGGSVDGNRALDQANLLIAAEDAVAVFDVSPAVRRLPTNVAPGRGAIERFPALPEKLLFGHIFSYSVTASP